MTMIFLLFLLLFSWILLYSPYFIFSIYISIYRREKSQPPFSISFSYQSTFVVWSIYPFQSFQDTRLSTSLLSFPLLSSPMFSYILGQLGFFYSLIIVLLLLLCTKVSSSSVPSSSSSCPSIDLESTSASLFWVETFQCNTKKDDTEKGDTKSNELNDIHGNIYGNWYTSKKHCFRQCFWPAFTFRG